MENVAQIEATQKRKTDAKIIYKRKKSAPLQLQNSTDYDVVEEKTCEIETAISPNKSKLTFK